MNLLEDFKPFLKSWCKENHKPCPPDGIMNDIWKQAWEAYMKTTLVENWEDNKEYFNSIKLLTKTELKKIKAQEELDKKNKELIKVNKQEPKTSVDIAQTEEKELSAWEVVKNLL